MAQFDRHNYSFENNRKMSRRFSDPWKAKTPKNPTTTSTPFTARKRCKSLELPNSWLLFDDVTDTVRATKRTSKSMRHARPVKVELRPVTSVITRAEMVERSKKRNSSKLSIISSGQLISNSVRSCFYFALA